MTNTPYIFDLNNITSFIFGNPKEKNSMIPNTREVKEVKVNDYTGQNTIRYDMIRMFIDILDSIEDPKVLTMGQNITLNTLKAYELIKDINEENNE